MNNIYCVVEIVYGSNEVFQDSHNRVRRYEILSLENFVGFEHEVVCVPGHDFLELSQLHDHVNSFRIFFSLIFDNFVDLDAVWVSNNLVDLQLFPDSIQLGPYDHSHLAVWPLNVLLLLFQNKLVKNFDCQRLAVADPNTRFDLAKVTFGK